MNLKSMNLKLMNLKSMNLKSMNLKLMNLKSMNLKSMNLKSMNLKSMNLKLMNLKCSVFVLFGAFGTFWCLVFFLCFFVLVKSYHKKKKFKTDLITSFILLLKRQNGTNLCTLKTQNYEVYDVFLNLF